MQNPKVCDLQFLSCMLINTPVRKLTTPEALLSFVLLTSLSFGTSFIQTLSSFTITHSWKAWSEPVHSWNSTRPDCHCVTNPNSHSLLFFSVSIFLSAIRWQQLRNSRDFYDWLRFLQSDSTVHGSRFPKLSAILRRWWSLVHAVSDW